MQNFEIDLEKYQAPIPSSGCYLLIHVYKKFINEPAPVE